jgi:hypothetical protein
MEQEGFIMNKGTIQAFAAGIILSTAVIAGYRHWFHANDDQNVSTEEAKSLLKQQGYSVTKTEDRKHTSQNTPVKQHAEKNPEPASKTDNEKKKDKQSSATHKDGSNAPYTLSVRSGMTSIEIAAILVKEGILEDESSFEQYMERNELNKHIQIGDFVLTDSMTMQQVAKTITK